MTEQCRGRYPAPGPRQEPFEVTYRCGKAVGHDGAHGPDDGPSPATVEKLRTALERARDALFNPFEPDNQSRAYHDVVQALREASLIPSAVGSVCCTTGRPCTVDPCASCPDHPIAEFHKWLDTYGHKVDFDRGDMAACWYAARRAAKSVQSATDKSIETMRKALEDIASGELGINVAIKAAKRALEATASTRLDQS